MRILTTIIIGCLVQAAAWNDAVGQANRDISSQVRSAAQDRLTEFLNRIPAGQEASYGFESRREFVDARVGRPYLLFTVDSLDSPAGGGYTIRPLEQWKVAVNVGGTCRAMLTVEKVAGSMRAVDFGAAVLARELAEHEQGGDSAQPDVSRGILRLFDCSCDLLLLYDPARTLDEAKILPLASAVRALTQKRLPVANTYTMSEYLPILARLLTLSKTR
ncbi:hypothetical protein EHM92_02185 [bacterium]|nr:MAG: hypothetical protein EHM92_02185 [bacterium]